MQIEMFYCKNCNSLALETDCFYIEKEKNYKQKGIGYFEDDYYNVKTITGFFYCPCCHNEIKTKQISRKVY